MIPAITYMEMMHLIERQSDGQWLIQKIVCDWIYENNIGAKEAHILCDNNQHYYGLLFDDEEGLMAFKLRWL